MFGFEKLEVWQKATELASEVYRLTRPFPTDERFGLTSQMRRSAVSIAANIAEGSGRGSDADFARFVEIAFGSLMELLSHARIAFDQNFLDQSGHGDIYKRAQQLSRMLSGLRRRLKPLS